MGGVIDKQNKIILSFIYESNKCIQPFHNGFAAVKINEKWGFVDTAGNIVIENKYEKVEDMLGTNLLVRDKEKWGLVDTKGKILIPCNYAKLERMSIDLFAAKKDNVWGLLNSSNIEVCPFLYQKMGSDFGNSHVIISGKDKKEEMLIEVVKDGKKMYINGKCQCLIDCK